MSPTAFGNIPRWLVVAFAALALLGFLDATYLTAEHVRGTIPPCTLVNGCDRVLTSPYSAIAGIPVSALGMLYYGTLLVLIVAFFDTANRRVLHLAAWLTVAGFLGSLYFLYVQAFILHAYCLYCLVSALVSVLVLGIGAWIMRQD